MDICRNSRPDGVARQLRGKSHHSLHHTSPMPYRQPIQKRYQRSAPEQAESDLRREQVPSLSADNSSRASSFHNLECRSEADDAGRWLPYGDEHTPVLTRSLSPISMCESNFRRTAMDLGALSDRQACNTQQMLPTSELWPKPVGNEHDTSSESQLQSQIISGKPWPTSSALGESKVLVRQPTVCSELSDSDSELEEDSNDDFDNDEWSGVNDNIEAALYQAVYPDIDLAAHLISTMYLTLVLSYTKKITSKVSSWQEKNITTCGIDSKTASTTTVAAETSSTEKGSSPKRDREYPPPDGNAGDDDDDDDDECRRKRPKEQADGEQGIVKPRFACPFYKKDPVKYSAAESGRKSCSGPGWVTIPQMKEHLQRAHRPVQCGRCYHIFPIKNGGRSSAVSERDQHMHQDDRCARKPDSLKEGINDAEWSRLGEEKNKNRKGKGKGKSKITAPEQVQSSFDQWYEIWVVLCPNEPRPSTPWYSPSHPRGLPQNEHFLDVSKNVNEFKLSAIKEAVLSGSDDDILTLLLECDQQKFSLYRTTFMAISDTTIDSFSNIGRSDPHSSDDSGSWQKVRKDAGGPEQSSSLLQLPANSLPLQTTDYPSHVDHLAPVVDLNSAAEVMMDGRDISRMDSPQSLVLNATYTIENVQTPLPHQPGPAITTMTTVPTAQFNSQHRGGHSENSARGLMCMDRNPQSISRDATYAGISPSEYPYGASGFTIANQSTYTNPRTGSLEHMWSPEGYVMSDQGDFDMNPFEPAILSLQNHQWIGQYPPPTSRGYHEAS